MGALITEAPEVLRCLSSRPGAFALCEGPAGMLLGCDPRETVVVGPAEDPRQVLATIERESTHALWVVALAFEAGRYFDAPAPFGRHTCGPTLIASRYDAWLKFQHGRPTELLGPDETQKATLASLCLKIPGPRVPAKAQSSPRLGISRGDYRRAFIQTRAQIQAGEIYQLNLTAQFRSHFSDSPLSLFEALCPPPWPERAVFFDYEEGALACASPELFLDFDPSTRVIRSGPIKGTCAQGVTPEQARGLGEALLRNPKERAEHLMILDLVRADLGRICHPGSIKVPNPFKLIQSGPVQHLVSEVEGNVREGLGLLELLAATFPPGSVTGAPKRAALMRIQALESCARGFYCGAIGRVGPDRGISLTLPIRTACLSRAPDGQGYKLAYGSGGGLVADSNLDAEWEELLLKATRLRRALQ